MRSALRGGGSYSGGSYSGGRDPYSVSVGASCGEPGMAEGGGAAGGMGAERVRGRTGVPRGSRSGSLQAAGSDQGSPPDAEDSRRTGSGVAGGPWPSSSAIRSAIRRFVGRGSSRRHSAPATPARQRPYITTTQVAGARPAYRPWISAAHQAGYASACRERHRPAIPPVSRGTPATARAGRP